MIDEIGFHQATSVAELLADRGCQVEVVTNGMVVGPGPRHHPRHGELVDAGRAPRASCSPPTSCRWAWRAARCSCCTTRPATMQTRTPDWVVLAVPANPVEWLYLDLKAAGVQRRAGRRLRRAPPGPRRRDRGRAGGSGADRDRGGARARRRAGRRAATRCVAECGGRAVLVGDGTAEAAARPGRRGHPTVRAWEAPGFAPAAWAAALAPVLADDAVVVLPGVARRSRPRAPAGPRSSAGRCWPAPSAVTAHGARAGAARAAS